MNDEVNGHETTTGCYYHRTKMSYVLWVPRQLSLDFVHLLRMKMSKEIIVNLCLSILYTLVISLDINHISA
jgi:hypothetical protein